MTEQQPSLFCYELLVPASQDTIVRLNQENRILERRIKEDGIRMGSNFATIRDELRHNKAGGFESWMAAEAWKRATVYNLIQVYESFGNCPNFGQLDIALSAQYILAAPSTPEPVRQQALQRAEAGETITHAVAKRLLAEHRDADAHFVQRVSDAEHAGRLRPLTAAAAIEAVQRNPEALGEFVESQHNARLPLPVIDRHAVHYSSATPEWYTPQHIIQRVIDLFGEIDLDPCSNSRTDPHVPARVHYTAEDDGLAHRWHGYVYMNPPYGDEIAPWIPKLIGEHYAGRVPLAVALVPARTDTDWFAPLFDFPICFVHGRLRFSGSPNSAPFPSAIVYLGDDAASFFTMFSDLGPIVERRRGVVPVLDQTTPRVDIEARQT